MARDIYYMDSSDYGNRKPSVDLHGLQDVADKRTHPFSMDDGALLFLVADTLF